jgi:phosphatidate cytidylyltransferase
MLRTRLWMGALLVALTVGVVVVDNLLAPVYPFLFLLVLALALVACFELLHLLPGDRRPSAWLCYAAVAGLVTANWAAHIWHSPGGPDPEPWHWVLGEFTVVVLAAFLVEMAVFREAGHSVVRIALTVWIASYLGVLPSFLAQLRWLSPGGAGITAAEGVLNGATLGLVLAIFVPKCCDIGAYFTGRFLGRHKMAPVLSPKKTWEGAAGGLALAVAATIALCRLGPPVLPGIWAEAGFGLTVGLAGMLGDLAESLVKRDCVQKDASQAMPGFGGVLDVVDSIVFAAPVVYGWLRAGGALR